MSRLNKPELTPPVICLTHSIIHEVINHNNNFQSSKDNKHFLPTMKRIPEFLAEENFHEFFNWKLLVSSYNFGEFLLICCLCILAMSQEIVKIWLVQFAWLATSDSLNSPMFSSAKKLVISSEIMSVATLQSIQ